MGRQIDNLQGITKEEVEDIKLRYFNFMNEVNQRYEAKHREIARKRSQLILKLTLEIYESAVIAAGGVPAAEGA